MMGLEPLEKQLSTYLTADQVNWVRRAFFYAEQAHDGQKRRSGEAYVTHPLAVAHILADMRMDHQSLMAALLHDVIEDTLIAKEALANQFGATVAELVDGVSKLNQMRFESKAQAQAENFQKMAIAMARDIRVILVKLGDRLHNMRTLDVLPGEKRHRIAQETLEIYAPIANRLGMHSMFMEFEDLAFKAMYPMRSERIQAAVRKARGNRKELIGTIQTALLQRLAREGIEAQVLGREKHLFSIYKKMRAKRRSFSEIMDVFGFRVVVDKVDTCYRALGAVHGLYKPVPGRFKDYIAIPKANNYQSLHTTLFGAHGVPIEIQIRTQVMDELACFGIAAHWLYKSSEEEPRHASQERASRWVKSILELQQRAASSLEFIENVKIDLFPDEVYVFTPKGRIMELPRGSTAVDFAYAVHTDVGNRCIACRINRRMAPLSEPLQSGCTVEIITASGARPNPAWLGFVVSGKARTHIRHSLKQQQRSESVALGQRLLDKILTEQNTSLESLPTTAMTTVLKEYKLSEWDDLLEEIGLGNRMSYVVAQALLGNMLSNQSSSSTPESLAIRGTEGLVLSYAKCCMPIPGDSIVGYVSAGQGVVVHRDSCPNVLTLRNQPEKCIALSWAKDVVGDFSVALRIALNQQRGQVALLCASVHTSGGNIEQVAMEVLDGQTSMVQLTIRVEDRAHLARVIKRLRALKEVLRISRVRL